MKEKKRGKKLHVLGYLTSKTRITASRNCFQLEVKKRDKTGVNGEPVVVWNPIYFYSRLQDLLNGYVRLRTRMAKTSEQTFIPDKNLLSLIDTLRTLDNTVKDIGERLSKEWDEQYSKLTNNQKGDQ